MKVSLKWKEGMQFVGQVSDHMAPMDAKAPLGKDTAPTPKELVALGLGGCTAMDVAALLKKYKQQPRSFQVEVETEATTGGHPVTFKNAKVIYQVEGEVEADKLLEAVRLSMTKFCGVTAMLSKALPITYVVQLNGQEIGQGQASFD